MRRTRIKFCGITRAADAVAAGQAGADAIGLVFHAPSPRAVSLEQATEILSSLPPLLAAVGLFVDASSDFIRQTAMQLGISCVQLHGHEPPEQVAELRPLRVIKAVRVHGEELEADMERWAAARARHDLRNLAALLLESPPASPDGAPGGTGAENDWEAIAAVRFAEVIEELPAIVVAGGLTPANVGEVVRRLEPYAVDVSSGIESARGIKSLAKMAAFSYEVRAADQSR